MPARLDNMPKQFRRIPCVDCGEEFQATGPSAKRCAACRPINKLSYERERDRATRERRACCMDCSAPFPPDVHAATKRCAACSEVAWKAIRSDYRKADPKRANSYAQKHYEQNREDILGRRKTTDGRKKISERIKRRRNNDPGFRLHGNISRVVALSLNGDKAGRKWETILGYTREQLVVHLERQFTRGMTWENMGGETGWQVDHIIPRASFKFSSADDPDFKACWALTNLRPLWRAANASKRDNRLHLI